MGNRSENGREQVRRQLTLADVAEAAGVSLATASRALYPRARTVPEPVAERVRNAAQALGYVPNAHARSLAAGATTTVGLVVHDVSDPYYAEVAAGVVAEADAAQLLTLMIATQWDPPRVLEALSALRGQRARAVVLAGSGFADDEYRRMLRREVRALREAGIGVASISDHGASVDLVLPDNRGGAADLARALLDLGHRRFGIIGGRQDLVTGEERIAGFREAIAAAGIEIAEQDVVYTGATREGAYVAATGFVERRQRPTAIFAVSDALAVAALGAILDRGIRVPDQLSIAGFSDVAPLRDVRPALTTVRLPLQEIGRAALGLAISPTRSRARKRTVPAEIIMRASTARAPRRR